MGTFSRDCGSIIHKWDKELANSCMTKGSQTVMNGRPFSLPKREKDPKRYMSPHTLGWLLDHPPVGLSLRPAHCVPHVPNMLLKMSRYLLEGRTKFCPAQSIFARAMQIQKVIL